uniref:ABC transmembrane type-1 domain-containing protein n=1 Tax=Rhabditophanes sp. KR3021 TaxID=114890 RepID=A0AC35U712_9BILA
MFRYFNKKDFFLLFFGIFLSIFNGIVGPQRTIIFRGLTNTLIRSQQKWINGTLLMSDFQDDIFEYARLYACLGFTVFVLGMISISCLFALCERQLVKIRFNFLKSVLHQDMAWFDQSTDGDLTTKMNTSTDKIRAALTDKFGMLVQTTAQLVTGFVIAFCLNAKLAGVMMAIAPFMGATLFFSKKLSTNATLKENKAYKEAGTIAEEVISGIKMVMAFNGQHFELARYQKYLEIAVAMGIRKAYIIAFFNATFIGTMFCSMAVIFWYGIHLILTEGESLGTVFAIFWAVMDGTVRFGNVITQINVIVSGIESIKETFHIIDRKPEINCNCEDGIKPETFLGNIKFNNVHFAYPTRPSEKVIKNISFEVEANTKVALVGASGCGKSSMIKMIMRYYNVDGGNITIDGHDLNLLNINWLRNQIGIVSQEANLFSATIKENIKIGKPDATDEEIKAACKMANASSFIENFPMQYDTFIGEGGGIRLSGGMAQRIQIARALIRKPQLVILDEATSALGHIVEVGNHEELMERHGVYFDLVMMQQVTDIDTSDANSDQDILVGEPIIPMKKRESISETMNNFKNNIRRASLDVKQFVIRKTKEFTQVEIIPQKEDKEHKKATIIDVFRLGKKEIRATLFALIFIIGRGLAWPLFSILYGKLVLFLSSLQREPKYKNDLDYLCLGFLVLGLSSGVCAFVCSSIFGRTGENLAMKVRLLVYKQFLRQDTTYFEKPNNTVSKLTEQLSSNVSNVQAAIDIRLSEVLHSIVALCGSIVISFFYGWSIACVGLSTSFLFVLVQVILGSYLKKRTLADNACDVISYQIAQESIKNVRTVQAMTQQTLIVNRFLAASKEPCRKAMFRGLIQAASYAVSLIYIPVNFATLYSIGSYLVEDLLVSPYVLFQVVEALNNSTTSLMNAATYFPEYVKAQAASSELFEIIRSVPLIDNLSEEGRRDPIKGNISFKFGHFAYPHVPETPILKGIDFDVNMSQTIGLVGPSGSGKSTTIQLLERYYDLDSGKLKIDNIDIKEFNIRHYRNSVALVSQEPILFNISMKENIAYGMTDYSMEEVIEAAKMANIHDFIDSLPQKYDTAAGVGGGSLSGGQRMRLTISRAVIRKPKILLLDEPTSSLDSQSEKAVQEALEKIKVGRTSITIAHRLSSIQNSNIIAVVNDGAIDEIGSHQELINKRGLYYSLVNNQNMS